MTGTLLTAASDSRVWNLISGDRECELDRKVAARTGSSNRRPMRVE